MSRKRHDGPIYLSFEAAINAKSSGQLLNAVESNLSATRKREVHLIIGSPGGDVNEGLKMYHKLRSLPIALATYAMGTVQSMAIFILQAGDIRLMYPDSNLYSHCLNWNFGNNAVSEDILKAVRDNMVRSTEICISILKSRCGMDEQIATRLMTCTGETILPERAKQLGLIDKIGELKIPVGTRLISIRDQS